MFKKLLVVGCWLSVVDCRINLQSKICNLQSKIILLTALCLLPFATNAQCAMCRASLEGENNVAKAEAVNDGIVYLMVIPYFLAAILGIIIYRMYKKRA